MDKVCRDDNARRAVAPQALFARPPGVTHQRRKRCTGSVMKRDERQ
jgi:hypothetical protein